MRQCRTVGLTAVGSGIGHALLQSLRLLAHPPRVVGFDASRWCRSRAECDEFIDLQHCTQPGYIDSLLQHCVERGVEVLIPGSDTELPILADHRDAFATQGVVLVISSPGVVRLCRDKLQFGRFANSKSLPFAPTWSLDEAKTASGRIRYPVVVKPAHGSGSKGVWVMHTPGELAGFNPKDPHVVQPHLDAGRTGGWSAALQPVPLAGERVPNQDNELVAMQVVSPDGEILGCMTSINTLKGGIVFLQDPVDAPEVESAARSVAEALIPLGLAGPFNLQGRWTADGPLFYEPNPRFTGGTQMRSLCGFREVEACLGIFLGGEREAARALLKPSRSWVALRQPVSIAAPRALVEHGPSRAAARVLVTGASGYLGSEVVRQLLERTDIGHIAAMTRDPRRLENERRERGWTDKVQVVGCSLESAVIGPEPFEGIFHLAALREPYSGDISDLISANLRFTSDLARYARETGVRTFVFSSSQSVYGIRKPPAWKESDPLQPEAPYAWTKVAGEELIRRLRDEKIGAVSLRFSRLFGLAHGLRWREFPHSLARRVSRDESLVIHGTGEQSLDILNVRDAAAAALAVFAARKRGLPEAVNVGSGRPITVLDLFSLYLNEARDIQGRDLAFRFDPSAGGRPSFGMDITLAREALGWAPQCDLRSEIRGLIIEADRLPEGGN